MTDLSDLSPEKRALLEMLLKEREAEPQAFPLSSTQRGLWFLDQMEPGSPTYILAAALRLSGRLDPGGLRRALNEVVRRHESLRTTFAVREGEPVQLVAPRLDLELPEIDLASIPEEEREAAVRRLAEEQARTPFDLAAGPLLRATLLRLAPRGENEEHVLVFTMHHIVSDAWSMGVLVGEVAALYNAFFQGLPSPLPELELQYPDYVEWQQEWLESAEMPKQLAYWLERLAGAPGFELPTDRPLPESRTWRIHRLELQAPAAVAERLRDLCRRHGATSFMALLAAFQTLVLRYTGQPDVVLGTTIANRRYSELEKLIGPFLNTLALRGDLRGGPTFEGLLETTRRRTLEAYAHQDLPFELLVKELKLERDSSRAPLFQVIFQATNTPGGAVALSGLTLSLVELTSQQALDYDLVVNLTESPLGLAGSFNYNADLYDASTVRRFMDHYLRLLEAALEDPSRKLSELPLLSSEERLQLLLEWNDTPSLPPPGRLLHQAFEERARYHPEGIALIHGEEKISAGELNRRANRLAHGLRALGVGPERIAGVLLDRSPDLVVALLAVLKAGGAYLPLDPSHPEDRRAWLLADAGASVVVTREIVEASAAGPDHDPDPLASPESLAYLIYTSGSTGEPKGVAIRHAGPVALVDWASRFFTPEELSGVLFATSLSFDVSIFELFATLSLGGKVIVAQDVLELPELPAASEVTLVCAAPSAAAGLLRLGRLPDSVRTFSFGGEALQGSLVDRAWSAAPGLRRTLNFYGPSEDTTYSTWASVEPGTANPTIGRSVDGKRALLLDADLEPVPTGVPGEIWVGGVGVARGYHNRPDLTAWRFVPDPFAAVWGEPGARLYRTGDLARRRPDGELEFLGRADFQVKVRGFRIELEEVEAAVASHPSVAACAVLASPDGSGGARLAAYVVPEAAAGSGEPARLTPDLRAFLRASLPDYMVPSLFIYLERMPLTSSGKVDRRALPRPDGIRPDLEHQYVAPRDAVEEAIARIWKDLLGVDRVGVEDNFFELGGHSLLGTRVIAALREAFGVELPLRGLFEKPTVAELALAMAQARVETEEASEVDRLLANLENLSEEEVEALLAVQEEGEEAG